MVMRTADLWRLQEIDSALDTRHGSLDDARANIGDSDDVADARAELDRAIAAHRDAQSAQKDLDLEANDLRAKIAPAEQKLYSGEIKNPKELKDLQDDIDSLKRHLSSLEDREIESIAAVETAERDLNDARQRAESLETEWRREQEDLHERIARLEAEIESYERERREQAEGIDRAILQVYDHVRRAHQGRGVARLDRNLCMGCRISLPTSTVNKARAGSALVQCPNCERILIA